MSDEERVETEQEEVEAHSGGHWGSNAAASTEDRDDDDDVEAHVARSA